MSTLPFSPNHAVRLLKKRYLQGEPTDEGAPELENARRLAQQTIGTLLDRLGREPTAGGAAENLPEDVLLRIEDRQRRNLEDFKQDLAELNQAFARHAPLGAEELALLDSLCAAAEASASATFRNLWRR